MKDFSVGARYARTEKDPNGAYFGRFTSASALCPMLQTSANGQSRIGGNSFHRQRGKRTRLGSEPDQTRLRQAAHAGQWEPRRLCAATFDVRLIGFLIFTGHPSGMPASGLPASGLPILHEIAR